MSHLQENQDWQFPVKLRDLLETYNDNPQDVDLYHWDYDNEAATTAEDSMNSIA